MKKRWIAIALLTVLLMGIGGAIGKVGIRQESGGSAYALYFVERDLALRRWRRRPPVRGTDIRGRRPLHRGTGQRRWWRSC